MNQSGSFADVMKRLRRGDPDAARQVFERFAHRLVILARDQFDSGLRCHIDPEDIVQSVYRSFFRRYADGQFIVGDWEGLWGLLTVITVRKCLNREKYLRRDRRDVRREVSLDFALEQAGEIREALARDPTPAEAALLAETLERLMRDLDGHDRTILTLSLQGYTSAEISDQIGRSRRTVQRVLERVKYQLTRMQAEEE
jgi:RNA polymerase sigma-70 factor (ECF subfamily)